MNDKLIIQKIKNKNTLCRAEFCVATREPKGKYEIEFLNPFLTILCTSWFD